jgi:signal transduction histidine kinase
MGEASLVDRLAALPKLAEVPRDELEWLAAQGEYEAHPAGYVLAPEGRPIQTLWIILSGLVAVRVDRGIGPRRVIEWRPGDVTGMLPYSRMTAPPGDNYLEAPSELIALGEERFRELVQRCPAFTAYTVHSMLDRARSFNTSDLQDEKMVSLGKLSAGLAHELNNPASATVRAAELLAEEMVRADAASRDLGAAGLTADQIAAIEGLLAQCSTEGSGAVLSAIEQADREDEIAGWLEQRGLDPGRAETLADASVTVAALDHLASDLSGEALAAATGWLAARCQTQSLAVDIQRAATRIHELVAAVKRFTHMDKVAGPEPVDVESGLRDTIRMVASKAKAKGASISLEVEPGLPPAHANGGELNQVWLNLIDNALDAVGDGGRIEVAARRELDRVVVRVVDDGPGIPREVLSQIFDPFFTTKPPGQGTGLGLDIARRLVRRYDGEINIESAPGRTEFAVELLAADARGNGRATGSPDAS